LDPLLEAAGAELEELSFDDDEELLDDELLDDVLSEEDDDLRLSVR